MPQADPRVLIHSPSELATEYVVWAERIQAHPGIPFDIPTIDKVVIPMRPGDLTTLIARPGHCKSSLMAYMARTEAERIVMRGAKDEVVVYVTWESSAEELCSLFASNEDISASDVAWGRADLEELKRQALNQVSIPIWVIGHGIGRAGQKMPRMYPDVILGAIESMKKDFGVQPSLLLFDYIQLIPIQNARDRVQQVSEIPARIKELALRVGAPAVAGAQARREVDDRAVKIPNLRDAQWGSAVEQASDKVFGLSRPILYTPENYMLEFSEFSVVVTENLLIVRLLKQRGGQGRATFATYFDPAYLKLGAMEVAGVRQNL